MILQPDEQNALDVIDDALGVGEPHLAGMFTIFTRLTAGDGIPPDEDRVRVRRPAAAPPPRRRSISARVSRARRGRPGRPGPGRRRGGPLAGRTLRFVLIPAALLVVLSLIAYASVTSRARCVAGRPARSAAAADFIPASRACPMARAAELPGTDR
jgi:hypothetical protein